MPAVAPVFRPTGAAYLVPKPVASDQGCAATPKGEVAIPMQISVPAALNAALYESLDIVGDGPVYKVPKPLPEDQA